MTVETDKDQFVNYVKCLKALQTLCLEGVLPCVEDAVHKWHTDAKKKLQPCSKSPKCTFVSNVNKHRKSGRDCPWFPKSCNNCVSWGHEIESVYWPVWVVSPGPSCRGPPIIWKNIIPSELHNSQIEVAKGFAVGLSEETRGNYEAYGDFDPASLLKIMMHFGECHKRNTAAYEVIKRVSN